MFIAEKGLEIETVQVDLRAGEHRQPSFLQLNPNATVPVLELDDGTCLRSTAACRVYLEAIAPEPALLGSTALERGLVADHLWRIEYDGFMAVAECFRNSAKGMRDRALAGPHNYAQIPELAERGSTRAGRFFSVLDAGIKGRDFFVGTTISAVDIDAYIFIEFANWIKLGMPESCMELRRWHAAMSTRDSAHL